MELEGRHDLEADYRRSPEAAAVVVLDGCPPRPDVGARCVVKGTRPLRRRLVLQRRQGLGGTQIRPHL